MMGFFMGTTAMIHVKVEQLLLSNVGFAIILKSLDDDRALPIVIGAAEAQSIAIFINKVEMPRPLTHDLLKNMLDFLECRLTRIEIHRLENGTFYANLILDQGGKELQMDARPSDSIALALRCNAQIFVHKDVMNEASIVMSDKDADQLDPNAALDELNLQGAVDSATPLEKLKEKLENAVEEERYEDAAKLRDEIQRLDKSHTEN
jgi:bifunctional DNase/RNase